MVLSYIQCTSTLKGQKGDQTIDDTDMVSKKHRCYIEKFPFVLIIQEKPELLQKTYFRSNFLLFLLLHREGRCCNPRVFKL